MAELIALVGSPGRGKSTSLFPNEQLKIEGLNLKETLIVNVSNKSLATRGWQKIFTNKPIKEGGNYIITYDANLIVSILDYVEKERLDIKNVVIEDVQYLMGFEVMKRAHEKGYDKWSIIGDIGYKVIGKAKDLIREDLFIWFIYHDEKGPDGEQKIKTAGKMVDDTITLEGLFSTILFAGVEIDSMAKSRRYYFLTNADGTCKARSKYGTFETLKIPNDAGLVRKAIEQYNKGE